MNPNIETAQILQGKFEFYLVALTFTILGLSIQTSSFGGSIISDSFELLGWFVLFISGLAGLSRLEWIPVTLKAHAEIQESEEEATRLRHAQSIGLIKVPVIGEERATAPIDEAINSHEEFAKNSRPKVERIENISYAKYQVHKWGFALGVLLILVSRSIEPINKIIANLCG